MQDGCFTSRHHVQVSDTRGGRGGEGVGRKGQEGVERDGEEEEEGEEKGTGQKSHVFLRIPTQ